MVTPGEMRAVGPNQADLLSLSGRPLVDKRNVLRRQSRFLGKQEGASRDALKQSVNNKQPTHSCPEKKSYHAFVVRHSWKPKRDNLIFPDQNLSSA
jgi:hypothetical protein